MGTQLLKWLWKTTALVFPALWSQLNICNKHPWLARSGEVLRAGRSILLVQRCKTLVQAWLGSSRGMCLETPEQSTWELVPVQQRETLQCTRASRRHGNKSVSPQPQHREAAVRSCPVGSIGSFCLVWGLKNEV